jgi:hypothetical protein
MGHVAGGSPTFVYGNVRHYVALRTLVQLAALTPSAARVEIEIAAIIAE